MIVIFRFGKFLIFTLKTFFYFSAPQAKSLATAPHVRATRVDSSLGEGSVRLKEAGLVLRDSLHSVSRPSLRALVHLASDLSMERGETGAGVVKSECGCDAAVAPP